MTPRLLSLKAPLPPNARPCQPHVEIFSWPDGTRVAFDANSLCAVQVDAKTAEAICERPMGFNGLLFCGLAPTFKTFSSAPLKKLVLNVTHGCNLACKYCFAAGYRKQPVMPVATALKALEMFPPKAPLSVAFFGGEPLLGWETMTAVAERVHLLATERGVRRTLHVTTNGTLIDGLKAAALKRYGFSVLVSLDGPEEIHDANRPMKGRKKNGSFRRVMAALRELKAAGLRPMARATFSETDARIVERLDFFESLYNEGLISGASIEPAILSEGCGSIPKQKPDREKLAAEWHAAAEWFVARVKAGRPFPFFYFRKLLDRVLNAKHHGSECGAGRGYLTLGPDGTIFACHRESGTAIGHFEAGFDAAKRADWLKNGVGAHPECSGCWARYLCGGGCPQNRVEVGGGVFAPMPHVCAAKRAMMREVFWIAAQLTSGEAAQAAGVNP